MKHPFITLFIHLITFLPTTLLAQENKPFIKPIQEQPDTLKASSSSIMIAKEVSSDSSKIDSLKTKISPSPASINDFKTLFDQVITRKDEIIIVKIIENNIFDIRFTYPLNTKINIMEKGQVKKIIFSGGHTEVIATAIDNDIAENDSLIIVDEKDWEKVDTTSMPERISGLMDKGEVSAHYEADKFNMQSELMEKNALIILKKRTARLKAHIIFIEDIQFQRAYGELPYVEIKGRAYGL